jgi:DMSO/TMAO reductase YedYZ molybdopterin-dependent catalytic subunit
VSFFHRNRAKYAAAGVDVTRIPPGQYVTERWPVLHEGTVPPIDTSDWTFTVDGMIDGPATWSWDEFVALGHGSVVADIHCVTKWTKLDTHWEGVPVRAVWEAVSPPPNAAAVMVRDGGGYSANLPVEDFLRDENLFAHTYDGAPLPPEHGGPMRLMVPHLYFWKSVKWVTGLSVLTVDAPGYWEQRGYHIHGDPFTEQRFTTD